MIIQRRLTLMFYLNQVVIYQLAERESNKNHHTLAFLIQKTAEGKPRPCRLYLPIPFYISRRRCP